MLRTVFGKVMWVGRATIFMMGLAVMLAVVLGVATTALAGTGVGATFNLGKTNSVSALSKLVGSVSSPMLLVDNNGPGTAIDLRVGTSTTPPDQKSAAPMKVDSQVRVDNFNADQIDGLDSTAFQMSGSKAADSDKLDGKDSTQFADSAHTHSGEDITSGTVAEARIDGSVARDGEVMPTVKAGDGSGSGLDADQLDGKDSGAFLMVNGKAADSAHADRADSATNAQNADRLDGLDSSALGLATQHNRQQIATCDTPPPDPKTGPFPRQACAPLQVVVPPGKRYIVSVWSSFSVHGFYADPPQEVRYCSAMKTPGQAEPSCITPFGIMNKTTILQEAFISASSSGETHALTEGTYTFGTVILPQARDLFQVHNPDDFVITKVMVRDASAPQPTGVSIP